VNAANSAGSACQKSKLKKNRTNCGNGHHNIEECWSEGGGTYGKAPDWWKKQQSKKQRKAKVNTATHSDSDDDTAESAHVFQDPMDCYLSCIDLDSGNYDKCSVRWDVDATESITGHEGIHLESKHELATCANTPAPPFYCDSGATSHISPNFSDLMELMQIPIQQVHGMNGSSVAALGRGKIRLCCGKGRVKDALYIPTAALHLFSIGQLCDDGLIATFNSTGHNFRNKNGKVIARGTQTGKDLYHFNGNMLIVEHAYIAHAASTLETWHCCLGHVSYQSVIDMAKNGLT